MPDARVDAVNDVAGKLTERVAAFVKKERLPGAAAGIVVSTIQHSTGFPRYVIVSDPSTLSDHHAPLFE